ncbi:Protein MAIN-LIKE 2 [Linum grandiflorum]
MRLYSAYWEPGKNDYAKDGRLKLTWLKNTFGKPSQISSTNELRWKQYARAYALACIGSFLLADRSGSAVHLVYLLLLEQERQSDTEYYAWGAAALAYAYTYPSYESEPAPPRQYTQPTFASGAGTSQP